MIVGNRLFLDAAGMLGIFYGNDCISNSLNVLCDFCGIHMCYPRIEYSVGMNYMPGELTAYKEFRRLLPSQILNIITNKYDVRPLLPNGIRRYETNLKQTEMFVKYFSESLKNMRGTLKGTFMLALTGGVDSRTLASLLEYAGIEYKCFTLRVKHHSFDEGDIPSKVAQILGKEHQYIQCKKRNFSKEKREAYIKHSAGMAKDGDYYNYSYNQYDQLLDGSDKQVIIMRSNLWEIAECYYGNIFPNKKISYQDIRRAFRQTAYDNIIDDSLKKWLEYIHSDVKNKEIDDVDRFYWEIRDGCWLSSVEQACDVMDGIKFFQPCNSRIFQSILFGYEESERMLVNRNHQKNIIQYACPKIAHISYDGELKKSKLRTVLKRIKGISRKSFFYCKWYGWKGFQGIWKEYIMRIKRNKYY